MAQKKTTAPKAEKPAQKKPALVPVCFGLRGMDGDVLALYPPKNLPPLLLRSKKHPQFSISLAFGEKARLAPDTYVATASYFPIEEGQILGGKIYSKPTLVVNEEVEVTEGKEYYEVPGIFDCLALVLDPRVCERYRVHGFDGRMTDLRMFGIGERKVVYLRGRWDFPSLELQAMRDGVPSARFSLVTDPEYTGHGEAVLDKGQAYAFDPEKGVIALGPIDNVNKESK